MDTSFGPDNTNSPSLIQTEKEKIVMDETSSVELSELSVVNKINDNQQLLDAENRQKKYVDNLGKCLLNYDLKPLSSEIPALPPENILDANTLDEVNYNLIPNSIENSTQSVPKANNQNENIVDNSEYVVGNIDNIVNLSMNLQKRPVELSGQEYKEIHKELDDIFEQMLIKAGKEMNNLHHEVTFENHDNLSKTMKNHENVDQLSVDMESKPKIQKFPGNILTVANKTPSGHTKEETLIPKTAPQPHNFSVEEVSKMSSYKASIGKISEQLNNDDQFFEETVADKTPSNHTEKETLNPKMASQFLNFLIQAVSKMWSYKESISKISEHLNNDDQFAEETSYQDKRQELNFIEEVISTPDKSKSVHSVISKAPDLKELNQNKIIKPQSYLNSETKEASTSNEQLIKMTPQTLKQHEKDISSPMKMVSRQQLFANATKKMKERRQFFVLANGPAKIESKFKKQVEMENIPKVESSLNVYKK